MHRLNAKTIIVILCATVAVGAVGSRFLYYKVLYENSARNACISHLQWIAGAKQQAPLEMQLRDGASVTTEVLANYIEHGWPTCPAGGKYTPNPIGKDPTCSFPRHSLAQ